MKTRRLETKPFTVERKREKINVSKITQSINSEQINDVNRETL